MATVILWKLGRKSLGLNNLIRLPDKEKPRPPVTLGTR